MDTSVDPVAAVVNVVCTFGAVLGAAKLALAQEHARREREERDEAAVAVLFLQELLSSNLEVLKALEAEAVDDSRLGVWPPVPIAEVVQHLRIDGLDVLARGSTTRHIAREERDAVVRSLLAARILRQFTSRECARFIASKDAPVISSYLQVENRKLVGALREAIPTVRTATQEARAILERISSKL